MLDQLRLRVSDMIWPKRPADAAHAPPASPPPAFAGEADIVQRLKDIIAASGSALAGRVNLLGLSRIKEHFGETWQRVAERAERIASSAIERRLTPRDIYSKWDDFDFVLVFADLTPAEAQIKCALLAQEIARNLIGEEGAELIEVKTAIVRVDGEFDFAAVPARTALLRLLQRPAETAGPAPRPDPIADRLAGLCFRYRPMWDPVRRNAVLFQCVPLIADGQDGCRPAGHVTGKDAALTALVDVAARRTALQELARLVHDGQRLMLAVPVHFETLAKISFRLDYIRTLDPLAAAERRLLLFELLDVPHGVLQTRLLELVMPLQARAYGVVAQVDLDYRDFAPIKESGLRAAGVDVSAYSGSEEALIGQALRFGRAARKAGLAAYLRGVRSLAVVRAARAAFTYIDGDSIAALSEAPAKIPALDFAER